MSDAAQIGETAAAEGQARAPALGNVPAQDCPTTSAAAEGQARAPALPPAWSATARLEGSGLLLQLTPSAPRPAGPALTALVNGLALPLWRVLKPFGGTVDDALAVRFAAGELLGSARLRLDWKRQDLLGKLVKRLGPLLLGELLDALRAAAWLAGDDAQARLAEALGDQVQAHVPATAEG